MKKHAWDFGLAVLFCVLVLVAISGCTESQLSKSEQLQKQVAAATTQPIPVAIESSVPYGPLAGTIGALVLGTWAAINVEMRKNRNAKQTPTP